LSASDITATGTTILAGFQATVSCQLTGAAQEPSSIYWTGNQYTAYLVKYANFVGLCHFGFIKNIPVIKDLIPQWMGVIRN